MKIKNLKNYGVPSHIVNIWEKHYSPCLLPIQEEAVRECSFGIEMAVSTRDHREDDQHIIQGDYKIAVMVYEKFYYFLLKQPDFLIGVFSSNR
ncbi:MAG: hypothetical protein KAH35_03725 [Candidatus Atribacteria bacterium]|nr:hypothetical protein [Candidatus Atribacteria bacterium]